MPYISDLIELPPEANPLTPQNLYNVLIRASSSNQHQIQTSAQQLQNWERQQGFYSSLQSIFIDASLPFEVRYLAAIQLKNGTDKYWRKTAQNAVNKEEKALIRSRCLEAGFNEVDHRLALQNALFVAKIVRLEYPHDWPDAISTLTGYLRDAANADAGNNHLSRGLLLLLCITKELSTAKLQRSRVSLYGAAPDVLQFLAGLYVRTVDNWMGFIKSGGNGERATIDNTRSSLLSLRILRRLLISGYEHPNRNDEVRELWSVLRAHFGEMLSLVTQHGQSLPEATRQQIERHLIQTSKLHLNMINNHPASFPQLPDSMGIAKAYWALLLEFGKTFGAPSAIASATIGTDGDAEDEISCMEKLGLKGLLLLRACVKMVYNPVQTFKYQHAQDKQERKDSTESMKANMLSELMVREMMETLVTRFFVFRARDLREWEEEPSEWERREEGEGESWEFSVRICAEKLFLDIVIHNKQLLIQPLLHVFSTVATPQNTDVLLKDSIYAAVGIAAPILENHLDFGDFLNSTLVPEMQIHQPGYNILRRRIAIIIGQWMPVKNFNGGLVYQIYQYLLHKEDSLNDVVVRVTAGRQLKNVIDPWPLEIEHFTPYAESIIGRLMRLIQEVDLLETKIALLNTLSTIVMRMEHHVNPYADQVVSLLPPLWEQAGDEYLMKQTVLGILSALITSMKDESRRFHNLILPLIESSIRPESETRAYLLEDAMELWSAIIAQTPEPSPEILNLLHHLFPMFDAGSDSFRKVLDITEQYILLAPQAMLEVSSRLCGIFSNLLTGNLRREANGIITHLIELLIQMAGQIGGTTAVQRVVEILAETKVLDQVLSGLKSAYDSHQTTGPNRIYTEVDGVVETAYFAVLARILVSSPRTFVDALAASMGPFDVSIDWLLTEWFSHHENIGNPDKKKLMCLALTNLLELGVQEKILNRMQDFMTVWTDVITECMEYLEEDSEGKDSLVYNDPESLRPQGMPEASEDMRRRNRLFSDPVHRINVKNYVRSHLQQTIEVCGGLDAFRRDWLVNVDGDVLQSFAQAGIL